MSFATMPREQRPRCLPELALDGGVPPSPRLRPVDELLEKPGARERRPRIRCPSCRWVPRATDEWMCTRGTPACGHCWNTFDTRGRCPGCGYRWEWTVCLACHVWARHAEWYEPGEPRPA